MNIGLLFGGKSYEHDISIISANVIYHALKEKHNVILLYIDEKGVFKNPKRIDVSKINKEKNNTFSFCQKGIKNKFKYTKIDVIVNVMHGLNGEDGTAAVIANLYNIPFVGSGNISSGLLLDKYFTYATLRSLDIDTIDTKSYQKNDAFDIFEFPVIVKPARLGSSIGINKIDNEDQLHTYTNKAFEFDNKIVIQPFINDFRECNQAAYIYKGEIYVSNVEEVFKSKDILSFDDKYLSTKINKKHIFISDEDLFKKISTITRKIYHKFELCGLVRIDYIIKDDKVFVNEINTTPGSLAFYLFEEDILGLLEKQMHNALFNFQNQKATIFKTSILSQSYSYKK